MRRGGGAEAAPYNAVLKTQIRKSALAARRALSQKQRAAYSREIAARLFETEIYKASEHIMCYAAYNCEVETDEICRRILADGKRLYLPRCTARGEMLACRVERLDELRLGKYGILEPQSEGAEEDILELVIAPASAYDANMGRMGYGGGYYDRFLPKTAAKRCAIAFSVQKVQRASFEETDVLMDMIITEREMIIGE